MLRYPVGFSEERGRKRPLSLSPACLSRYSVEILCNMVLLPRNGI